MATVTVSRNYRITIPKEVREQFGLKPGDRLRFVVEGRTARFTVVRDTDHPGHGAKSADAEGLRRETDGA